MTDSTQLSSDKRVQRSKQAILTEPYKLLSEGGIGGVSIDEVSRRSGAGENIDSDNIKQHKRDVFRLMKVDQCLSENLAGLSRNRSMNIPGG